MNAPTRFPTFSSMTELAGALAIPKGRIQAVKKAGCPAFDAANRVSTEKLLIWFFAGRDGPEEGADWAARLKRAQALTAENELKQSDGELVEIGRVHEDLDKAIAKARAVMTQKLETELPPKCDGRPAAEIAEVMRTALDEVFSVLSAPGTYS